MRGIPPLIRLVVALVMIQPALSSCNADNCARAVTGSRSGKAPDVTSRQQDCSSYMLVTVTPALVTTTVTETHTATSTIFAPGVPIVRRNRGLVPRQVTVSPASVPTYASACTGTHYASACSCWGITQSTATVPAPVTTTTVTVTTTDLVCEGAVTKCGNSCHDLQWDPNNCGACGNVCPNGYCVTGQCSCVRSSACRLNTFWCNPPQGNLQCACVLTTEGTNYCAHNDVPCVNAQTCNASSDCAPGYVCVVSTCCSGNRCLQAGSSPETCASAGTKRGFIMDEAGKVFYRDEAHQALGVFDPRELSE